MKNGIGLSLSSAQGGGSLAARDLEPKEKSIVTVVVNGDLLLRIDDQARQIPFCYRVSSSVLRQSSPYFEKLLDGAKFSEGAMFATKSVELLKLYVDVDSIPAAELPIINISNTGLLSENSLHQTVLIHFFDILHNTKSSRTVAKLHAINHIAVLAAIADRFSAIPAIVQYSRNKRWSQLSQDAQIGKGNTIRRNNEILRRQKIFSGYVYGFDDWVMLNSRLLVESGSMKWIDPDLEPGEDLAPWWNLPGGLEG